MSRKNRDRGITPVQRTDVVRMIQASASFSGPLPPPETLERYNQTLPGLAERIIVMAESQHSHRLELGKARDPFECFGADAGHYSGFRRGYDHCPRWHMARPWGEKR